MALKQQDTRQAAGSATADAMALAELMFPAVVQCLSVAARYRVADVLADGPLDIEALADKAGTDPAGLRMVLEQLSGEGIFQETAPGVFANTSKSDLLRPDAQDSLHSMALMVGEPWLWSSWGALDQCLATGKPAFELVHGMTTWAWLSQHPESARIFNLAMTELSDVLSPSLVAAYPEYAGAGVLADLGGGQGTYLAAILNAYPSVGKGVLVDLPAVVDQAREHPMTAALAAAGRFDFFPGSFFEAVPEGVDVFVTKQIMHSWSDEQLGAILRRCRAASPGARIVAAEMVHTQGVPQFVRNFNLVMHITMGGNIRTESDFAGAFGAAGYRLTRIVPTETAFSLVVAEPAD